jgi:hypothetical protein
MQEGGWELTEMYSKGLSGESELLDNKRDHGWAKLQKSCVFCILVGVVIFRAMPGQSSIPRLRYLIGYSLAACNNNIFRQGTLPSLVQIFESGCECRKRFTQRLG